MRALALLADWLVIAVLAMLLGACGGTPVRYELVESQKLQMVVLDPQYLKDCDQVPPPDRSFFQSLGIDEREDQLVKALMKQYEYTQLCTQDKRSLRELIQKQERLIDQHNAIEAKRVETLKQSLGAAP